MPSNPPLSANSMQLSWDDSPREGDVEAVRGLVHSTGVFSAEEVRIAGELVEDGMYDPQDYAFVFARMNQGRKLAGYACFGEIPLTDNRYDLYWIAVHPSLRGQNVAAELLKRVETRIRNSGGRIMYAETSGRDLYKPAHKFYEKNGFELCADITDFYKLGDNKLIYSKRLMAAGSPRVGQ
jgi:ribosomal protein S18 acetylase RimI-like enzyme